VSRQKVVRRGLAACGLLLTLGIHRVACAEDSTPPRVVESITPEFPKEATANQGHVVVAISVDETGAVTDVAVLTSGGDAFDAAALEAARKVRFEPARRGDQAVASRIPFTFDFKRPADAAPAAAATPAVAPGASAAPPTAPTTTPTKPAANAEEPEEIAVRGERPPREPTKHSLSGTDIRNAPGTNGDLLRSVENLPGVARPAGLDGQLIVRGSDPRDTGVFVDGTWIISAYHFGGITSVIPSELIERLDFYPGNFSPEYGRLQGGIVELEMRSPRKDHLGGLLQMDLLDARAIVEGPITKTTRFALAGRRSWVDAWIGSAAGDSIVAAPVYYDYQAMLEQDFSKNVTARVSVLGSDDRTKLLFAAPSATDPSNGGTLGLSQSFFRVMGRVDARLSRDVRWVNKVSWGENHQSYTQNKYDGQIAFNVLTARSDLRMRVSDHLAFVAGADVLWGRYDIAMRLPPMAVEGDTGPLFARPVPDLRGKGAVSRPAAYTMLEVRPVQRLLFTPGVRVDYMSDTGRWTADPRIGARFDLSQGRNRTTLKAAYGIFHQSPDPDQSISPFGTPGIRSSWAEHASFGVEQRFDDKVELSVEPFAKRFHDLIVASTNETGTANGVLNQNTGSGRAFGLEWLLKWVAPGRFSGFVSYTLSRSERRDRPTDAYHLFEYDQTHILSATGRYELGKGWSIGSRFRYVSGSPYTPYVGSAVDYDAGAYAGIQSPLRNSARSGAFHHLDVRIDKQWQLGAVRLTAYLDVQNVYNHQSEEGRTYSFDYRRSEPQRGLPILPILGVRGEL
jgi:TonB family protein